MINKNSKSECVDFIIEISNDYYLDLEEDGDLFLFSETQQGKDKNFLPDVCELYNFSSLDEAWKTMKNTSLTYPDKIFNILKSSEYGIVRIKQNGKVLSQKQVVFSIDSNKKYSKQIQITKPFIEGSSKWTGESFFI